MKEVNAEAMKNTEAVKRKGLIKLLQFSIETFL